MASIGIEQLKRFAYFSKRRQDLARRYVKNLSKSKFYRCLSHDYDNVVPHIFVIEINSQIKRDIVMDRLASNGIQCGIHYFPNHKLNYFQAREKELKNTEKLYKNILTLPLHPDLNTSDIDYICEQLLILECT
jgi:dTDP-4-amino-4,6-dideoxygalactose transaminase